MKRSFWLITVSLLLLALSACAAGATPEADEAAEAAPAEAVEAVEEVEEAAEESGAAVETEAEADVEEAAPAEGAAPAGATQSGDDQPSDEEVEAALVPEAATVSEAALQEAEEQLYGLVAGDIEDGGFNQLAWEGLQRAADELGVEVRHVETHQGDDYVANISQLLDAGADGIVTVGQALTEATRQASEANPDVPFISVDIPSQTTSDLGLLFSTDEPAFMAGYLAAGMSDSGTVCTYGGRQIPPVLIFMVGFEAGIDYYNRQNEAAVELLGWETDVSNEVGGTGLFVGSFSDQEAGRRAAEELFDQGCDIIFPVAGGAGIPAAEVAQERGLTVIGVDADQTRTEPDLADVYLTSVLKRVDVAVFEAVRQIHEGGFFGLDNVRSNYIGTLTNGGVDLAPFHSFEDAVPQALQAAMAEIRQQLIDEALSTAWPLTPPEGVTAADVQSLAGPEAALSEQTVFGDLLGDGSDEAVTVLISDDVYELTVVAERNGRPTTIATTSLGEEIALQSLDIADGEIVVLFTEAGEDAAQTRRYRLETVLVEIDGTAASAAESNGDDGAGVTETEVITFLPEEIPTDSQAGSCFTSALGLGREDAYRCMVENNIYDPCFVVDDDDNEEPPVVCGADPTTGETGFVLELTEPLPEPDLGTSGVAQPWLIELADGTVCGLLQGTRPGNEEIIGAYGCTDQTYLGEDLQEGDVWQAEQVVFDLGDDGFVVTDSETVAVRRVWR